MGENLMGTLFETRYATKTEEEEIVDYIFDHIKKQKEPIDITTLVTNASKKYRKFSCFAVKKVVWYLISTGDLILTPDRKIILP
jgi:predicted small metal-binding protein